jgi:trans-aconitate 2-methyltransferase
MSRYIAATSALPLSQTNEETGMSQLGQDIWNAQQYLRFENDRLRPFLDLVAQTDTEGFDVRSVVDLGCGPGNATALLAGWWPDARIVGVDSSPAMVEAAQAYAVPGSVEFELGDVRDWQPAEPVDVILANAVLQWIPGHLDLIPELARHLTPKGILGFQVPGNFTEPSHTVLAEVKKNWVGKLPADLDRAGSHDPALYLAKLVEAGLEPDVWETTYTYVLASDPDPKVPCGVTEFVRGTALRPVVNVLSPEDAADFTAEYDALVREAYPIQTLGDRTVQLLPYRRIFAVGHSA